MRNITVFLGLLAMLNVACDAKTCEDTSPDPVSDSDELDCFSIGYDDCDASEAYGENSESCDTSPGEDYNGGWCTCMYAYGFSDENCS